MAIHRAVSHWNVNYGRQFGINIIPTSWSEHAVSEFGDRPQAILNKQLVEFADLGIALFANRLGTDTGHAPSGTWEEIEELHKAGKQVSILRSVVPTELGAAATEERLRLERHLEENGDRFLYLTYDGNAQLQQHVNNTLSRIVGQLQQRIESDADSDSPDAEDVDESKGVWPRVEVSELPKTDSKGRIKTERRWRLILSNMTGRLVRNVTFELDSGDGMFALDREHELIETMAPGGEVGFPLHFVLASGPQATCIVTWEDSTGSHETRTTVRR